ncbi:MAG: DNA polymerase Y family protein [Burkholderiales bacterium]|nr:DNA polymerase Y family protein [Burkholderiales bacterium]MDE1927724.1 DNA polymerase Y family protein [Burkholderiales bacterium]MDE2159301.1 DNA polymerase Y family protein [Burkholderiales bacterium]MDE2504963.1 DNA polymerase Y family protein [Burkholderiales bacterium]
MLWAALLPDAIPGDASARTDALSGLATWCLQFTPRVAVVEALSESPAVVMEVEASVRLFGGKRRLAQRVREECAGLGVRQLSWAPTSLAAVALARSGASNGFSKPLDALLDGLPIEALAGVARHQPTLARLGCRTLGQVRALPRGGLSRRFDAELLAALDQAYGLRPEAHTWIELPEAFHAKLELMARVEMAPALLFGARRLLLQMSGWLAARHGGVTAFTLKWCHDSMRSRTAGDGGALTVRTAQPSCDIEHLTRLLAEHLAHVELQAPVGDLELLAVDVRALEQHSLSLLPEPQQAGESLVLVLERIAARLGPERVLRPVVLEDHRLEWMCHWQPAPEPRPRQPGRGIGMPQPTFVLPEPLRLATRGHRPMYQGVLQLLAGPHRVEGGWWDRTTVDGRATTRHVARDYWVALSEHAGVLWVFQTRLADDEAAWFLHGSFA